MLGRTASHPDHAPVPQLDLLRDLLRESRQLLPCHRLREVRPFDMRHRHAAMVMAAAGGQNALVLPSIRMQPADHHVGDEHPSRRLLTLASTGRNTNRLVRTMLALVSVGFVDCAAYQRRHRKVSISAAQRHRQPSDRAQLEGGRRPSPQATRSALEVGGAREHYAGGTPRGHAAEGRARRAAPSARALSVATAKFPHTASCDSPQAASCRRWHTASIPPNIGCC